MHVTSQVKLIPAGFQNWMGDNVTLLLDKVGRSDLVGKLPILFVRPDLTEVWGTIRDRIRS